MSRLLYFAFAVSICVCLPVPFGRDFNAICDFKYCKCAEDKHPYWTKINCTLPSSVRMDIFDGALPNTTSSLSITGSVGTMFGENAFTGLKDLRAIIVNDAKDVVFRGFAATDLDVLNLSIDMSNCEEIRFEKNAFLRIKGPLTVNIDSSAALYIEGEAFSWLLFIGIKNVGEMEIAPGAFSLEPTSTNIGKHGPGMSIHLTNLTIPEIPRSAFGSSAAKLYMEAVEIQAIRTGAFSANTYNDVIAINCSIHVIENTAFSESSLINYLKLNGVHIKHLTTGGFKCAISTIKITSCSFDYVQSGGINTTTASVMFLDNIFHTFMERGFIFSTPNRLLIKGNVFDDLPPNAISIPGDQYQRLTFAENEIERLHPGSLSFVGKKDQRHGLSYYNNYFGVACFCNMHHWISKILGAESQQIFLDESYCTVDELIARCFNTPDQNMVFQKFLDQVCKEDVEIKCEKFRTKTNGIQTEIKNTRFPHKNSTETGLSHRNKKVVGIVIVTVLVCIAIAMIFSLIRWMRRKGYFFSLRNWFVSSNPRLILCCARWCNCRRGSGTDNTTGSVSFNRYSERLYLNDLRPEDAITQTYCQEPISTTTPPANMPSTSKFTQTLPEEITQELIQNLKQKLDTPDKFAEAREMIEHLYELNKLEDLEMEQVPGNVNEDHVYDVPMIPESSRPGENNKKSVGTKTPSLEKLLPLSPYYRQTALVHDYVEPKDAAVHLYTEISNNDKDRKNKLGLMPDVIGEQAVPRGPYLQSILSNPSTSKVENNSPDIAMLELTKKTSSMKSNKSKKGKMANRPLPNKPVADPSQGTSTKHG